MKFDFSSHGIVALVIKDDKFLLLKDTRKLMLGYWAPPHGRCKTSDSSEEEAVKREVYEETGLRVIPVKRAWTTEADTKVKTVSFWIVRYLKGEVKLDKRESSNFGWFTLEEALNLKLYPGTKKFLTLVKSKKIPLGDNLDREGNSFIITQS